MGELERVGFHPHPLNRSVFVVVVVVVVVLALFFVLLLHLFPHSSHSDALVCGFSRWTNAKNVCDKFHTRTVFRPCECVDGF